MKTIGTCKDCKWWKNEGGTFCESGNCACASNKHSNKYPSGVHPMDYGGIRVRPPYISPGHDFGCIHWEPREGFSPDLSGESVASKWILERLEKALSADPDKYEVRSAYMEANYQPSTAEERLIDDLRIENDCAVRKIQRLSSALVTLGIDPTQI